MALHAAVALLLVAFQLAAQSTAAAGVDSPERDPLLCQLLQGKQLTWTSTEAIQPPPIPAWPQTFSINFYVYVEQYGNDWSSTGALYYDWTSKVDIILIDFGDLHGFGSRQRRFDRVKRSVITPR